MAVSLLLIAGIAGAGDIVPPNWRDEPGWNTTYQGWEFLEPGAGPQAPPAWAAPYVNDDGFLYTAPDWGTNPYGTPQLFHIPGPGAGWHAKQPTGADYDPNGVEGDGWVNLSGEIVVWLPNYPVANPKKEMWIQLVWEPQAPGNQPTVQLYDPAGTATTIPLVHTTLWSGDGNDPVNPWREVNHDVFHQDIYPNPDYEILSIRGGINVDELVIDTNCTPEPGTMGLLAIGGIGALLRRRRRS